MKKNFFKKLASVLSLALVVTSVAPNAGATASAAGTPDLAKRYTTVYEGSSRAYTTKNATGYTVKWSVTGEGAEYASITSKGKLTVNTDGANAAKNATVTVKAKFYKKSKLVKTRLDNVKIKVSATAVAITTAADATAVVAGVAADFNRTLTPANSTSKTYWSVTDKAGAATTTATVDASGNFTATAIGEYVVTATVKNAAGSEVLATATQAVKVVNKIASFKATSPKKLTVEFAVPVTVAPTKDNFAIVAADTNAKAYIKTVTLSTDKKTATVELYSELTTAKTYNLTATVDGTALTSSLAFVKGTVSKITAANQIVKAGSDQAIVFTVYDENGLDISDSTDVTYESTVALNATTHKINLANGVLAYVTIVYTNPTTGAQIKSDRITVTGSTSAATSIDAFTIAGAQGQLASWPTTATTSIAKEAPSKYIQVKYTNQYGETVRGTNGTDVSYEALDPSVLVVDANTGLLTALNVGTAQIKVTSGAISQIFTVTVTATAAGTTLSTDSSSVLKASLTNASVNKATVTVNVLDQNGNKANALADSDGLTYTLISGASVVSATDGGAGLAVNGTVGGTAGVGVDLYAKTAGTAIFKVTSEKASIAYSIVTVTVYAADEVVTGYNLKGVKNLDIDDRYDNDAATGDYTATVTLQPVNANGFVVASTQAATVVSNAVITVKKPNGDSVTIANGATIDATTTTYSALGTYTVTATSENTTLATATFTVVDNGTAPNVYVKTNTITQANADTWSNVQALFNVPDGFTVDSISFTTSKASVVAQPGDFISDLTINPNISDVTLYNVKVKVRGPVGGVDRTYEISTNQNITLTK